MNFWLSVLNMKGIPPQRPLSYLARSCAFSSLCQHSRRSICTPFSFSSWSKSGSMSWQWVHSVPKKKSRFDVGSGMVGLVKL